MMWCVRPEVAGELAENTQLNTAVYPPEVYVLHYRFEGWLGDDFLEGFPCFLVTDRLAKALEASDLTGWRLATVEVTASPEFEELYPGRQLPELHWLQVSRDQGVDFYVSSEHGLVVSDRALALLRRFSVGNAEIEPISKGPIHPPKTK